MKNLVIDGNIKMGKKVGIFNLPPKKTCTPTQWCLSGNNGKPKCYALRNNFLLPNVIKGMEDRYQESLQDDFVQRISDEINHKAIKYFRIHSSGDFYSKEYVQKWIKIAQNCPNTLFRSTTRRRDLSSTLRQLNSLSNVIIRESLDSSRQKPKMNLPIAAISNIDIVQNSYKCIDDCVKCQYTCWKNRDNVALDET